VDELSWEDAQAKVFEAYSSAIEVMTSGTGGVVDVRDLPGWDASMEVADLIHDEAYARARDAVDHGAATAADPLAIEAWEHWQRLAPSAREVVLVMVKDGFDGALVDLFAVAEEL
jgi:hypothetical protein